MNYGTVIYFGAKLTVPEFLVPLFPTTLPAKKWPTFCGAGNGMGDAVIPDKIRGVSMSPACFVHDIDWAATPYTIKEFAGANWRFLKNCLSLIGASGMSRLPKLLARCRCLIYFAGVSTFGLFSFLASSTVPFDESDPLKHPTVRARLKRLAYADIGLADEIAKHGGYENVN